MRGEAVDREGGEPCRRCDEEKDEEAVVGTAALGDRHNGEPGQLALPRHAGARELPNRRREVVDQKARDDADEEAQESQNDHRGECETVDLVSASDRRIAWAT